RLAGLVKERQADMQQIGRDAKLIGELMKTGEFGSVAAPAERIRLLAEAMRDKYLFGSDMEPSHSAPVVFESFPMFRTFVDRFASVAATTRDAAKGNGDVREAVANLFKECKSCHDVFVKPPE
ncbi:MAG TPA: cytochrome c, partial [Terriglobales bacterium]|nr:cytochrome c [Terriglobales bacterium]